MESTPCVERLRLYRLENDLTFEQLADRMRDAGYPVHTRNLHRILVNDLENGPRERTMFKVEKFVALLGATPPVPPRRRRRKAARR